MNKMLTGTNIIWNIFMLVVRAYLKWAIWNLFPSNILPEYQQIANDNLNSLLRKYCSKILDVYKTVALFCLLSSVLSVGEGTGGELLSGEENINPTPQWSYGLVLLPTTVSNADMDVWLRPWQLGPQYPDYNIRPSSRHLTFTQASTVPSSPQKKVLLWDLLDKNQEEEWILPFFFIGSCMFGSLAPQEEVWPTTHQKEQRLERIAAMRETEKERKKRK